MEKTGKTADEVLTVLNKESGLLGISGTSVFVNSRSKNI
jgi:acetate kinase